MAATASALPQLSPPGAGTVAQEDSNASSPLSDVDDKDDNDEEIEHMQLDDEDNNEDDDEHSKPSDAPKKTSTPTSDSDSILSDAHSDAHSDGNVTEAETERLFDTPKHQRQRDVVLDQFNQGQIFEHSPSKLQRTTNRGDEDLGKSGDGSILGENASVASERPVIDSPTKPPATKSPIVDVEPKNDSQDRKRKRSPGGDQSETEQPLRKRTSSVAANEVPTPAPAPAPAPSPAPTTQKPVEDTPMQEDEAIPAVETGGSPSPAERIEESPQKEPTPNEGDMTERATRGTKKATRGSRRKAAAPAEAEPETQGETTARHEAEPQVEITEPEVEEEVEAVTAHDEEMERKHAAYKDWTHIEEMFGLFRDRLYKDRLQRLEGEEQSLLASEPSHPEYLNMKQCLDDRLEQKLREINKELEYRMKAHEKRAVAQRAQIWGQYFQAVREKREKTLESLNREWYDVQTSRRTAHSVEDYGLLFPKDPAQRVRNAVAYNTEVSALASIAKYEGFPAGPEMRGASAAELEDDLAAMERSRRSRQKPAAQPREEYHTPAFPRLGPAGEQFLKDTPWANPNHSAHKMYPQGPGGFEGRVENAAGRGPQLVHVPAAADIKAPFDGANSKQRSPAPAARLSESPELSRTILNPAHNPMKRVGSLSGMNRGSKTAMA